jgi:pilus assembly protein CpaC
VVQAAGFKTLKMLHTTVTDETQVQFSVRVAEVSRQKLSDLGTSWVHNGGATGAFVQGGGPGTLSNSEGTDLVTDFLGSAVNIFLFNRSLNTATFVRALKTNGALRALAEPNLIAMNGQTASFLAGGEFPVPVAQGGTANAISVVFKEYGVRLNFKPTIIDEDHIRLELEPEVSTIDFANGVRFNGFVIPALRTRRARTGVELRDGQSFALAGLLDNNETKSMSKIPLIGDIPVLGNLFKSESFQKQETELMFIITAELVKPINRDDVPNMKGIDGLKSGNLLGVEPVGNGISGNSGFSTGTATEGVAKPKTMVPAVPLTVPTQAPAPVKTDATPAAATKTTPSN